MSQEIPEVRFHLTSRHWCPLQTSPDEYLDAIEGVVRFTARHQDSTGAIIDPFLHKEHQYSTPYYAHALGTLLSRGRATDLLQSGVSAMDWSTESFQLNRTEGHRVFFTTPLVHSLELYSSFVSPRSIQIWRKRLTKPIEGWETGDNNWSTYLMKGEWLRAKTGLFDRTDAVRRIEEIWTNGQRKRIFDTPGHLYHDGTSDPDTLAVEVVGRGNLLALVESGYDGPSAAEIRRVVEAGAFTSLLLQDPSGQMPCNGRTDNHVWADVGYLLTFEVMAEIVHSRGDIWGAGKYRRAACLAFRNIDRWRQTDGEWAGSYRVTKNHFDPTLRVGYQNASQYTNYNGALMHHLAEAFHVRNSNIPETPAPVEIGGFAFALDASFASAFANAGGMQMQINLRGDTTRIYNPDYWTALGVVRMGRVQWDTRLGPSDAARVGSGEGVSFAPTFLENRDWIRLASVPDRYEGKFSVQFSHPLLVRCAVDYFPTEGWDGPFFRHDFILTPDGILCTLTRNSGSAEFGLTIPLLANDGQKSLLTSITNRVAGTRYDDDSDEQNFIVLNENVDLTVDPNIRSSYGDLMPVRLTTGNECIRIFIYPRNPGDPTAEEVRKSFQITTKGFSSLLGRVEGEVYIGRYSAGGKTNKVIVGQSSILLDQSCQILVELENGLPSRIEVDRDAAANVNGVPFQLRAYSPFTIPR